MMIATVFSWIGLVTNQVAKLMRNLHEVISLTGAALDESHIQSAVWKGEVKKFIAMITQLVEVEDYEPEKFLKENLLQHVDAGLIQVLRKNIAWRVSN